MIGKNFYNLFCIENQYDTYSIIILKRVRLWWKGPFIKQIAFLPIKKEANTIPKSRKKDGKPEASGDGLHIIFIINDI